mgnify:CR=1 FL=1
MIKDEAYWKLHKELINNKLSKLDNDDYNDAIGCISTNETSRMGKKQVKLLNVGLKAVFIVIAVDNVANFVVPLYPIIVADWPMPVPALM